MSVRPIDYETIASWSSRASSEGVALRDTVTTTWFGVYDVAGKLVGCGGLIELGAKVRIRGMFTLVDERGNGYGTELLEHLVELAGRTGRPIEAYVMAPAAYERLGFRVIKRRNARSFVVWKEAVHAGSRPVAASA